jgi:hypothetical protein
MADRAGPLPQPCINSCHQEALGSGCTKITGTREVCEFWQLHNGRARSIFFLLRMRENAQRKWPPAFWAWCDQVNRTAVLAGYFLHFQRSSAVSGSSSSGASSAITFAISTSGSSSAMGGRESQARNSVLPLGPSRGERIRPRSPNPISCA